MITQLVMEKMEKSTESQVPETVATPTEQPLITFYDTAAHQATETTTSRATSQEPLIQLYQHGAPQQATVAPTATFEQPINVAVSIKPFQFEADTLTDSVQAAKNIHLLELALEERGQDQKQKLG